MKLPMTPVTSSAIDGFHHDPQTSRLTVRFKSGAHYEYDGVPLEKVQAMSEAASPGGFFSAKIRDRYQGKKL